MPELLKLKSLSNYRLWLEYDDGVEGAVDLSSLVGKGLFSQWSDPTVFEQVRLSDHGAPAWSDSIDLCPDSLYLQLTGQRPEDLFPNLRRAASDA